MKIKAGSQNFVKQDTSAHWYQLMPDGSLLSRHEAGLKEARVDHLYASPTSIEKDIRANPALLRWIKNEIAKAFVNNPRLDHESDQLYAERIMLLADGVRDNAAIRGTAIHDAIEHDGCSDPFINQFYLAYKPWHDENVLETLGSEVKMHDSRIGVAGTVDRIVQHKVHGLTILDYKTQLIKEGKKASFYDNFPRQLSFYAECYKLKHGFRPRIMSVVIDSQNPSRPVEKLYTQEEQDAAYMEFLCHVWLFCNSKPMGGFWPVGKWKPSFNL